VQIAQDIGRGMFGTAWTMKKATRRWLCGEVEAGYFRIKYQMPAQTAVAMIQVQPLTVMRFMDGTMPAFG
jgi:hypothetical protein